ncbi:hypothetical protein DRQ33_07405 [bacterium]|nr:MAG: hypothetical protein DRQ33_07405 [bacterium]
MERKRFWSYAWPPGFALIFSIIVAFYVELVIDIQWIAYIILIGGTISGEVWSAIKRKQETIELDKSERILPLSKVSVTFALIGLILMLVSVWIFDRLYPAGLMQDEWAWFAFHGLLWDTGVFCAAAIVMSIIAIIRVIKEKMRGTTWAIYSIIIAGITFWLWLTALVPIVNGMFVYIFDYMKFRF